MRQEQAAPAAVEVAAPAEKPHSETDAVFLRVRATRVRDDGTTTSFMH